MRPPKARDPLGCTGAYSREKFFKYTLNWSKRDRVNERYNIKVYLAQAVFAGREQSDSSY